MIYKSLLFFTFIAVLLGISSCGSNDDDANNNGPGSDAICENFSDDILALIDDIGVKAQAYATNPTTATCTAYVQSLDAYINGLNDFFDSSCIPLADRGAYQEAVDEFNESKEETLDACADL